MKWERSLDRELDGQLRLVYRRCRSVYERTSGPEFPCAYNRLSLKYRERFPPQLDLSA